MQVKDLEGSIRVFARTAIVILSALIALLAVFSVAYVYASLNAYNAILVTLITAIIFCIVAIALICSAIFYTYRRKKASGIFLMLTKLGLKTILPIAVYFAKSSGSKKKIIRSFYIELNNIVVESDNKKYKLEDTMLLLPHCLQSSECGIKVTNDPNLCKCCGKCKIGTLIEYARHKNMSIFIATGGTVARNIIKKVKPKLIVSVACERDLMSGISDITGIPVIGVTNMQPNGPCFNTDVNIDAIKRRIEQLTF